MTFTDVDWDVAELTRDLIDDNWEKNRSGREETVERPDKIELRTETNDERYRSRVQRGTEYVLVSETSDRQMEYADIFWESQNYDAVAFVEFSTAAGRDRFEAVFEEIGEIGVRHRKRPKTPGNWDNLMLRSTKMDDENFHLWVGTFTFSYKRLMDVIDS